MNMHNKFKIFTLLCALHTLNSFSSAPAPADISASLQAELDRIYSMPDVEALTAIIPVCRSKAEQWIRESKEVLEHIETPLVTLIVKVFCPSLAYCAIQKELASCNDESQKCILHAKLDNVRTQAKMARQELSNHLNTLDFNSATHKAFKIMENEYHVLQGQAAILLVDKEDAEKKWQAKRALWQQEKAQLQQEKKSLQNELNLYKAFVNGPQQIEGMPNVPGGVNPDAKPSQSR